MSLIAISLAIQTRIDDPLAKFLLVLLADRHNSDTGDCFPSVARLSQDSAISIRTVTTKLGWLADRGFIKTLERRRPNGSRQSNSFILTFVPATMGGPEPTPAKAGPKRLSVRSLPPTNWQPDQGVVDRLRERYPHHDTTPGTIDYLIREWIDYCHANGQRYVDFNAAWRQSSEKYLRRQSAGPAAFGQRAGKRGGAGSLSGAIRRVNRDRGARMDPDP